MRSKSPKLYWLSLGLLLAIAPFESASANATVTPPAPYLVVSNGGDPSVYYPSTLTGAAYYIDGHNGFAPINFAAATPVLTYSVSGLDATNRYLYIYGQGTTPDTYYLIPFSCLTGAACSAVAGGGTRADANGITAITVGLTPSTMCSNINVQGCTAGGVVDQTKTPNPGIRLRFVITSKVDPAALIKDTEIKPASLLQIYPERVGPAVTACPLGAGFFPGDGSILVDTNAFTVAANTTNGGSSGSFIHTFVAAQEAGALNPADYTTATIFSRGDYGVGQVEIGPIENSVDAGGSPSHPYSADYGIEDSAGIITFCGLNGVGGYPLSNVFATDIQGFLRESNCFVATASYRNGRAPGVMLLRNFRDEVLSRFDLGRGFIGWYYTYGPIAADWLIAHPIFRSVSLMMLMPLQAMAWVALHPAVLLVPLFALLVLLGFLAQGTGLVGLFILAALLVGTPGAVASDQPYIDSLLSELPKDPYAPTETVQDPYAQSIKRKIGKGEDTTGYSEEMRKQIGTKDGSEGYSDRLQRALPKTSGSAIEDYRNHKQLHPNKGSLDTRSAFGFNLMAGGTRTYTAGERQDVAYEDVYGNGWVPDFTIHYEWRPFTGSFIKKFGLYGSIGASFTKAQGVLNYKDGRFGSESHTQFKFITIPADVGLIYRFTLFDFVWPYFAGGPSVIGFTETRNDKQKGHHGYDFGYWFMGGVAFGLDWISPKSSWDQYESTGVKHSYFTVDYSYLESLSGGIVAFTVDGVQVGFTFEL